MTPNPSLRAFQRVVQRRSAFDGWFIEGVGTSADEPLEAGSTVLFNATASRTSDGPETIEVPVSVTGGTGPGSITFSAAVTGVDTTSFEVTVGDISTSLTVDVGGETASFNVAAEVEEEGTRSVSISAPSNVTIGEFFDVSVTLACTNGACDAATLRVEVGGGTLFSQARGPLSAGESLTETVSTTIDATGSVEIFAVWGQATASASVFVEEAEPEFDPDRVFVPSGECTVEPQRVNPPEDVRLSAVVENQNEESANATVEWTWRGALLDRTLVNVFAGTTQEAFGSATVDREGRDQVRAAVVRAEEGTVEVEQPKSVRAGARASGDRQSAP